MKNYYIAEVRVFVDGIDDSIEVVSGSGFDLNMVKDQPKAECENEIPEKRLHPY